MTTDDLRHSIHMIQIILIKDSKASTDNSKTVISAVVKGPFKASLDADVK